MRPVDAVARYLWEEELDVFTTPWDPPGHLVVREGGYTRVFSPGEVGALAAALWAAGVMDHKGRPLRSHPLGVREEEACP